MKKGRGMKGITSFVLVVMLVLGLCVTGFAQMPLEETMPEAQVQEELPDAPPELDIQTTVEPQVEIEPVEQENAAVAEEPQAEPMAQYNITGYVNEYNAAAPGLNVPVAGAAVTIDGVMNNQLTDGTGKFYAPGIVEGTYTVTVVLDGYKIWKGRLQVGDFPTMGNMKLSADAGSLVKNDNTVNFDPVKATGRVTYSGVGIGEGKPIQLEKLPGGVVASGTIKAGGAYEFSKVPNGTYKVVVPSFDQYEASYSNTFDILYDGKSNVDVPMTKISIAGSVSDESFFGNGNGRWLSDAKITLKTNAGIKIGNSITTNAVGEFKFSEATGHSIQTGTSYKIDIDCDGYIYKQDVPASVLAQSLNIGETQLEPVKITGTAGLTDPDAGDTINNGGFVKLFKKKTTGTYGKYTEALDESVMTAPVTAGGNYILKSTPDNRIKDGDYAVKVYREKYKTEAIPTTVGDPAGLNPTLRANVSHALKNLSPLKMFGQLKYKDFDMVIQSTGLMGGPTTVKVVLPSGQEITINTDANGNFDSFTPTKYYLLNGEYKLTFEVNKFERITRTFKIFFEEDQVEIKDLVLEPTKIYGRVRDMYLAGGIGSAKLTLYKTLDRQQNGNNATPITQDHGQVTCVAKNPVYSAVDGSFMFTHVPNMPNPNAPFNDAPGESYTVVAYASKDYRENTVNNITINYSSWGPMEIKMIPISEGYRVEGYVTDKYDKRAANATVRLYSVDSNGTLAYQKAASTNVAGDFMMEKVQPGKYKLKICYRGHALKYFDIEVKDEDLAAGKFKLTEKLTADFSGVIRDPNNSFKPVSGVKVNLYDKNRNKIATETTTDINGKYNFHFASPGTSLYLGAPYTVETTYHTVSADYLFYPMANLDFDYKGYDEDELNFNIESQEAMYRISGKLLESGAANATPFVGATVRLESYYYGTVSVVATNNNGEYHFYNVPPGLYTIYASKAGYTNGEERCDTIAITNKDEFIIDRIVRPDIKKYAVTGTVGTVKQFENSNLKNGVRVELWTDETQSYMALNTITDSQGAYTFPAVESGKYLVKVPDRTYGGVKVVKGTVAPAKVEVADKAASAPNVSFDLEYINGVTSISFQENSMAVKLYGTKQIVAYVHPSNAGIQDLSYKVKDEKIASVSSTGVVSGKAVGTTEVTVSANDGSKAEAVCTIRVVQPATGIKVSRETMNMFVGSVIPLKATLYGSPTENEVVWTSANTRRAQVDSNGNVRAISRGRAKITATSKDGFVFASCIVTVKQPVTKVVLTRSSNVVTAGSLAQIHASVWPSNANNKEVTYASKNTAVATVGKTGKVKGISPGTTQIVVKAADGSNTYALYTVKVNANITDISLGQSTLRMLKGQKRVLPYVVYARGAKVKPSWQSSNPGVATVDSNGKISARSVGQTTITISAQGISGTKYDRMTIYVVATPSPVQSISITGAPKTIREGGYTWLNAQINPGDATDAKLVWRSGNTNILSINADGKVNAKKAGKAEVTAMAGGQRTSVVITVTK